jgi:colanic acid/amylovoran biosynthesis glycosyltransferase
MRVAYILLHFPYLTETFIAEEIRAVQAQGVEVQIVSLLGPGRGFVQELSARLLTQCWYAPALASPHLWWSQIRIVRTKPTQYVALLLQLLRQPYPNGACILFAKRLVIFLKAVAVAAKFEREKIDLVHAHFASLPGAAAWVCARLIERPFSVTAHAYDLFISNDLLRLVATEADGIVAISEFNRQHIEHSCGCPPEKIAVIHCGVDLRQFLHRTAPESSKRVCDVLRIISVGSLNQKKGHACLIEACRLLKERGLAFTCTIVGRGTEEVRLRRLIEQHGLYREVILKGALPNVEVIRTYPDHDLFVLPCVIASDGARDGIPVVMMEAGAQALPIVSTPISGIPELVRHRKTGLLVPPHDASALADAICELADNPDLREQLGVAARALVDAEFNIQRSANRLVETFRRSLLSSA